MVPFRRVAQRSVFCDVTTEALRGAARRNGNTLVLAPVIQDRRTYNSSSLSPKAQAAVGLQPAVGLFKTTVIDAPTLNMSPPAFAMDGLSLYLWVNDRRYEPMIAMCGSVP
jgi:hypothetical protein